jgi:hypothetical protein
MNDGKKKASKQVEPEKAEPLLDHLLKLLEPSEMT